MPVFISFAFFLSSLPLHVPLFIGGATDGVYWRLSEVAKIKVRNSHFISNNLFFKLIFQVKYTIRLLHTNAFPNKKTLHFNSAVLSVT